MRVPEISLGYGLLAQNKHDLYRYYKYTERHKQTQYLPAYTVSFMVVPSVRAWEFRVIKIQNKCNATKINGNPKTAIGLLLHPSGTFPCPKCVAIWSGRRSQNSTPSKIGANVIKLVIMIFILFSFIFSILSQLTEPQHHFFHN